MASFNIFLLSCYLLWLNYSWFLSYFFPVWLRNQLISSGLELVLSHTEKSCIMSYYFQFSTNIYIKTIISKQALFIFISVESCL